MAGFRVSYLKRNNLNNQRNNDRYNNDRNGINYESADNVIRNIETKVDSFRRASDKDLDRNRVN